ncbi:MULTISPECIES: HTH-type transcriptional regulator GlpR [Halomicrobium]|uniref:Transcriptional regulator, DeoR family n=2 Tax=Halomicrobium mukohataei TaxID=57705 RepID=C7NZJ8_HALMD|nr:MULTISPECIES: HTH-type transcriptional regulator GlpR [Halomicrobium]ACV48766.1 transcriptional regulator, DeoR family [Halomicrobium mukohataei DSM 12286]QCD64196.1 DeoR/GlpR transcriptional regulator [Halomicrobium mukohataei]QFR19002.1 DeoR family transcriptional regulator [Halomicrobium sp. ZPS1]
MLPAERKRRIVELVTERDGCSVARLATELDFSKATIRRDLQELEDDGRIERSHGGAVPASSVGQERPYGQREVDRLDAKQAIAARAVDLLQDAQVVSFDAGTTTMAVARALPSEAGVEAVTNMPDLATTLLDKGIEVTVTGGTLRRRTRALVGPTAQRFLDDHHVDLLFVGTNSIDATAGLTTPNEAEAAVKSRFVEQASRVVLVADSSKFDEQSFVTVAALDAVDTLVTDRTPDGALAAALDEADVTVLEADA